MVNSRRIIDRRESKSCTHELSASNPRQAAWKLCRGLSMNKAERNQKKDLDTV